MPSESRDRRPWLVPVIVAAVAAGLFLAAVLSRGSIDHERLLGEWVVNVVLFLVFAAAAIFAYRALRRSRAPTAVDEARPADRHR
jgi:protein-S-isoprenylcysteine O-methyltransferase Ste14